jgi:hypothetical protein
MVLEALSSLFSENMVLETLSRLYKCKQFRKSPGVKISVTEIGLGEECCTGLNLLQPTVLVINAILGLTLSFRLLLGLVLLLF